MNRIQKLLEDNFDIWKTNLQNSIKKLQDNINWQKSKPGKTSADEESLKDKEDRLKEMTTRLENGIKINNIKNK